MSEFQYYEFRAIDRPLSPKETEALRELSTRAEITPTSFTNSYSWGGFGGDPAELMDRYFDAFVYLANWGTHRLMFRIPRSLLDVKAASEYCGGEGLELKARKNHVVLEFCSESEEGEGWIEGEEWMPDLMPLRADLMRGDLRALYLGWLASIQAGGWLDEDGWDQETPQEGNQPEPPVPPGLKRLSKPLRALADFLRLDEDLIAAAASESAGEPPAEPSAAERAQWVKGLPAADKDAYLVRLVSEEDSEPLLRAELAKRFREATAPQGKAKRPVTTAGRRTVAQLLAARAALIEARQRKQAGRAARERTHRDREQAEARSRSLDDLARREPQAWREVDELIETRRPKDYDRAVALLVDLRDLAAQSGRAGQADARIEELRQRHATKAALLKRIDQGLGK